MARLDNCPTCGQRPHYVARYDRFVCTSCRTWTDKPCQCSDAECPFPKSPDEPSPEDIANAEKV